MKHLQSILTQDNRATSHPIFLVFGWQKIYTNPEYDDESIAWVEYETGEHLEMDNETYLALCEKYEESFGKNEKPQCPVLDRDFDPNSWEKFTFALVEKFETCCFTEEAAKDYIKCNGHNIWGREYKEPIIYVASGWRNQEWQDVRQMLIDKAMAEYNNVSA